MGTLQQKSTRLTKEETKYNTEVKILDQLLILGVFSALKKKCLIFIAFVNSLNYFPFRFVSFTAAC